MENIFGGLIEFDNQKQFDDFVNSMNKTHSLKIIEMAFKYGLSNGLYSMEEVYCLYKCLSKLKEDENNTETDNIRDDDNHGDIG
jgi:hypothetical protein